MSEMRSFPSSRICLTCAYWGGSRTADGTRSLAITANDRAEGECMGGGMNRAQLYPTQGCGSWQKWSVLRSN